GRCCGQECPRSGLVGVSSCTLFGLSNRNLNLPKKTAGAPNPHFRRPRITLFPCFPVSLFEKFFPAALRCTPGPFRKNHAPTLCQTLRLVCPPRARFSCHAAARCSRSARA